eukprot:CAMPEP_0116949260 /NCGR_PEP_ID=MMETSP0467-20121206/38787_1 /TAXON_ID=283647 /ORGANISM="Mesodinium pulex, Strain SPMC105" /LENGTH=79 /DNA_ID=CAMNT_0004633819 /DNA_START=674 /DNA_END=913 /DNA_ORIENTATION=+
MEHEIMQNKEYADIKGFTSKLTQDNQELIQQLNALQEKSTTEYNALKEKSSFELSSTKDRMLLEIKGLKDMLNELEKDN